MKFLIYGAGAIGQAIGCMLTATGHHVDLVLRSRYIPAINTHGLHVGGIFGEYNSDRDKLGLLEDLQSAVGPYDYVLLTTKSYDTRKSTLEIEAAGLSFAALVSMQNGCGNIEILSEYFPKERCYGARVITGFEIVRPGQVHITVSADAIHIGSAQPGTIPAKAKQLAELITRAGHPAEAVVDIHQSLHAKLLYNCTLNPLGAILGTHYGPLGEMADSRQIMDGIIDETFAVIAAMGGTTPWPSSEAYRLEFYNKLLPATYHHRPSMLQDLEQNKPTEIESLTGYVSSQGEKHGVSTPHCDLLSKLVRCRESLAKRG